LAPDVDPVPRAAPAARHAENDDALAATISGTVTIETGGRKQTISIVRDRRVTNNMRAWQVSCRTRTPAVRPLWERADGRTLADDPQYHGRDFTSDGKLIGRGGDIVLDAKLTVELPEAIHGILVHVELADVIVAAHRYRTRWGMVKSVEDRASEIGRVPILRLVLRAGSPGGQLVLESVHEAAWHARPKRADVVRTTGFAFGLGCRYRIVVEGFGAGKASVRAFAAPTPAPDPVRVPSAKTDVGGLTCISGASRSTGKRREAQPSGDSIRRSGR